MVSKLKRTIFYDRHVALGAKMVEFGGWEMPVLYPSGIVEEHLAARKGSGLFDVSHMGRITLTGADVEAFLNRLCTRNLTDAECGRRASLERRLFDLGTT